MRLLLTPALIGLTVLTACNPATPDPRGVERGETLLTASGTGRAERAPDQATFTAGLSSIAPTAKAATNRNSETMNRVVASLAALGVEKRDVQTRNLSIQRIDYGANRGRYEATNTLSVRMRQVDRVGQAIAAATSVGADIVSGPNLSVADPEAAALSAYGAAYKAARAKADAYAAAAGLKVARVLAIHDAGGGGGTATLEMVATEQARTVAPPSVMAPPVMAGSNASMVAVRVEFALTAK